MRIIKSYIILLALALCACSSELPQIKVTVHACASPIEGRAAAACVAIDSTIYVLCGRSQTSAVNATMLVYDAALDEWSQVATSMPARVNATATTMDGNIYVGLGYGGKSIYDEQMYLRDFYRFEPENNSWTRLADYPSGNTVAAISFSDGQYIYVGFGFHSFTHELYRYNPKNDAWEQVSKHLSASDYPPRVMSPIAGVVGTRYFVGTGFRNFVGSFMAEYIPASDSWEKRTPVPGKARHNAAATATDEQLFVFGGWHYGDSLTTGFHYDDILSYSPDKDQWTSYGTMPDGQAENRVAARIGNTIYFGLGEDQHSKLLTNFYCFEVK